MAKNSRPRKPPKPQIRDLKAGQNITPHIGLLHEKRIGRLVAAWSRLEQEMENLIWHFLELRIEYGRIVTTRIDASTRIQMLRMLGRLEYDNDVLDNFNHILDEIDNVREDRNFIIHGVWGSIFPNGPPIAFSLRPKHDPAEIVGETFPHTRMLALIQKIQHMTRLLEWCQLRFQRGRKLSPRPSVSSSPSHQPNPSDQTH
jgi:hypothetical protein